MPVEGRPKDDTNQNSDPSSVAPNFDQYGNPRWPYLNLMSWRRLNFKCRKCAWFGDGSLVDLGEVDDEITELVCPHCGTFMAALSHLVEIPGLNKES